MRFNYELRDGTIRNPKSEIRNRNKGLIVLSTLVRSTAEALDDLLHSAGYATVWCQPDRPPSVVRGAAAGIWDGGQLSDHEAESLAAFARDLHGDGTSVIALLDFPRRDRCEVAQQLGAIAILGKPWLNAELLATLEHVAGQRTCRREPSWTRAA
jgi:hypothetical protein